MTHQAIALAYGGHYVDLLNPTADDFRAIGIRGAAHYLAGKLRFGAASSRRLTVAEHCVRCSRIAAPGFELAALAHESDEILLPDVVSGLKHDPAFGQVWEVIAAAHRIAFAEAFDVPYYKSEEVNRVDLVMLATEAKQLLGVEDPCTDPHWRLPYPPVYVEIECWCAEQAEEEFVRRWWQLDALRRSA